MPNMNSKLKKVAVIAVLVILFVLAGPFVMNLALGDDSTVIYAAYPQAERGAPGTPQDPLLGPDGIPQGPLDFIGIPMGPLGPAGTPSGSAGSPGTPQ